MDEKRLIYIKDQIKDLLNAYIDLETCDDYEKGKRSTLIFTSVISNQSEDFIQGVMEKMSEPL